MGVPASTARADLEHACDLPPIVGIMLLRETVLKLKILGELNGISHPVARPKLELRKEVVPEGVRGVWLRGPRCYQR